jgi:prepilin-type N-terminal cleavage/methylation domain-containing protein
MTCFTNRVRNERGASLLEIMVVVAIVGVLTSMTVIQMDAVRPGMQADGAMRVVMAQLNYAREIAISQRRLVDVAFPGGNRITVTQRLLDGTMKPLVDAPFEGNVSYGLVSGVGDTPDAFGNSSAIKFGQASGSTAVVTFNTEGMLVSSTTGVPVNGTLFLRIPNVPGSYRAVTVLGSTGRVRGFRWDGGAWKRV